MSWNSWKYFRMLTFLHWLKMQWFPISRAREILVLHSQHSTYLKSWYNYCNIQCKSNMWFHIPFRPGQIIQMHSKYWNLYTYDSVSCHQHQKWYIYLAADRHLKPCCFREPPRSKDLSEKRLPWKNVKRFAHISSTFSKIADQQARSTALGATWWACRSAI